ncbi:MAG: amidohydrolase family protein [Acidobacteria bacterium]|nr:amidohydrolase family protein [Acidobacteriota bacterium]
MLHRGFALAAGGGSLALAAALLVQPGPEAGDVVVLTGASVIDGTGGPPLERAALLFRDGQIQAVSPAADLAIPDGATRIDATGKTIIPGLINAHAHLNDGDEALPLREQLLAQLRVYAAFGVTTVQTLGDGRSAAHRAHAPRLPYPWQVGEESVRVRDAQADGDLLDRARLFPSGPNLVGATEVEAREGVDQIAELGVDVLKTRLDDRPDDMAPAVYRALIDQAHRRRLRVAAHAVTLEDAKGLADAGVDAIVHSVRDRDVDAELIAALTGRDIGYVPTLTRTLSLFLYETTPAFFGDAFFLRGGDAYRAEMERIRDPELQARVRGSAQAAAARKVLAQAQRNLKLLADGGVTIAMGTDSGTQLGRWQGYFEHVELELMVEAGLTPLQALVAATGSAARVMGLGELGTLEPGKWADFVVLDADPLTDIRNTRRIDSVWIAGRRLPD